MRLSVLMVLLLVSQAYGHPGIGIVQDSRGNVFFTDLKQVWKITPDGKISVAVAKVHTHELCLDSDDALFGEHLWYEGDTTKKWGHRVWCLKRDGTLSDVLPAREGFLTDYSFVRDRAGNMYWFDRESKAIKKRSTDGKIGVHASANCESVEWIAATVDGVLYFIDRGDLKQVSVNGIVHTVATQVSEHKPVPKNVTDRHYHMGLWTDRDENVYVAVAKEGSVLKVQANGAMAVFARSSPPWRPSGGLFDRDGNLWLLEYSTLPLFGLSVQARRIDREGNERVFAADEP